MLITAYFSVDGIGETGLNPTVTVVNITSSAVVVNAQVMTAVANAPGWYKYTWASYIPGTPYTTMVNGGSDTLDDRYITQTSDGSAEDIWGYERV